MTLSAAVLILVVVAIRALLLHRVPKVTFLALWGIVLCRLLVPFSISSRFSIYTLLDRVGDMVTGPVGTSISTGGSIVPAVGVPIRAAASSVMAVSPAMLVWLAGMLICALFFIVTHLRCLHEYRTALPVENDFMARWQREHPLRRFVRIRQLDTIPAPLTYGVVRPVVLLPKTTEYADERQLGYILAHEYTHVRRFDTLTKGLLAAALCIHWFNPLVWMMYVFANRDIELACDEAVVRTFGETARSAYARALIGMEEKKSRLGPFCNGFSKIAIEERIVAIMKTKRTTTIGIVLALALVVGIATAFATSAATDEMNLDGNSTHGDVGVILSSGMCMAGTLDGINYIYTDDGGNTWMTEAEYKEKNPDVVNEFEFWEIDEFEKWMEQEKIVYQQLADNGRQRCYDSETNQWGTWTQQDADELYKIWQEQLERMKQGYRYTKAIELPNGASLTGAFEPDTGTVSSTSSTVITLGDGTIVSLEDFDTAEEAEVAVKKYLDEQVKAGTMTQQEADEILKNKAIG